MQVTVNEQINSILYGAENIRLDHKWNGLINLSTITRTISKDENDNSQVSNWMRIIVDHHIYLEHFWMHAF